jgi:transcriptional regulator with XRE-family HTH domain
MNTTRIGPREPHRHYIREWMKKKGVTQEQMAGRLDVSQGTVSKMLKKSSVLTEYYLVGIAQALSLSVSDLFRDPNRPTQEELLEGLSDDQRQTVITMIEALRKTA